MKTPFAYALARLGWSFELAAEYFDRSLSTIKAWSIGRRKLPDWVWTYLERAESADDMTASAIIANGPDLVSVLFDGGKIPPHMQARIMLKTGEPITALEERESVHVRDDPA